MCLYVSVIEKTDLPCSLLSLANLEYLLCFFLPKNYQKIEFFKLSVTSVIKYLPSCRMPKVPGVLEFRICHLREVMVAQFLGLGCKNVPRVELFSS